MTTTTLPATHLALARRREELYREARDYAARVRGMADAGQLSAESATIADDDAAGRWRELQSALELAGVMSPGLARAAGLGYWVDPVLGVGVEAGEESP